ncbi:hypothetical protein [Flagellimonas meridianipacifica]|uniref:Uncharacterized protein n=1 Tax=Flagellimonas meridianipacifica TaxID=1080225 RepID=A0A2T0MD56_9FLAO|nr:hypothetical protein [Allomuricauda pacifica]PRX55425.1 hypothetical protein CLV81_3837 [Allomuricauda pacifica]
MKYLFIASLWIIHSFATNYLQDCSKPIVEDVSNVLVIKCSFSRNHYSAFEKSLPALYVTELSRPTLDLPFPKTYENDFFDFIETSSKSVIETLSAAPDDIDPFMELGAFEVWDEISDDAISDPEENYLHIDFTPVFYNIPFNLAIIRGVPDIPPEFIF